MIKIMILMND